MSEYKRKIKECSFCYQQLELNNFRKIKNRNGNFTIHHKCLDCVSYETSSNYWIEKWKLYLDNHKYGYFLESCLVHGDLHYDELYIKTYFSRKKKLYKASCIQCEIDRRIKKYGEHDLYHKFNNLTCKVCKIEKHIISFGHSELKTKHPRCLECNYNRQKINKKNRTYRVKDGITIKQEWYDLQFKKQKGLCSICKTPDPTRRLSVDHNHKTKKLRSLLCKKCNLALGQFNDSPKLLRKAASYLEKHD